jgi:hypothetical protein
MKMLHNPTVDRKNKVAENRLSENLHELEMEYERFGASYSREKVHLKHELRVMREELKGRLLRGRVSFSSLTSLIVISGILFFL